MNKKKNPELVRNINYTIRLNKIERAMFHELLKIANNPKPQSFIREMMTKGIVMQYIKKEDRIISDKLLGTLNEYRTVFKRLSNLIKNHDPSLNFQIEQLVMSMQKIIVRV